VRFYRYHNFRFALPFSDMWLIGQLLSNEGLIQNTNIAHFNSLQVKSRSKTPDDLGENNELILIKHYETESTSPINFKNASPKPQISKLSQNFKRKDVKGLKNIKKKLIQDHTSVKISELLGKSRPKSVESTGTPTKPQRIPCFAQPSLQTIMTTNDEEKCEKLLK